jgi:hypothetical protein
LRSRHIPPPLLGKSHVVFLFFSNRLGCLGSLILSAVVTLVLLVLLGAVRL